MAPTIARDAMHDAATMFMLCSFPRAAKCARPVCLPVPKPKARGVPASTIQTRISLITLFYRYFYLACPVKPRVVFFVLSLA